MIEMAGGTAGQALLDEQAAAKRVQAGIMIRLAGRRGSTVQYWLCLELYIVLPKLIDKNAAEAQGHSSSGTAMVRLARRGVHGHIVEVIARRIVRGEIREGQTLDLPKLREELQVSLTALREALKVLSAKGIVDARQRRGTFVRPRTDWNLLDTEVMGWELSDRHNKQTLDNLHELRSIIEPAAARLAAERATDEALSGLEAAIRAMARAANTADTAALIEADLLFHRLLLAAADNDLLNRLDVVIEADVAERIRSVTGDSSNGVVRRHQAVLVAVRSRDPGAAEGAVRDLISYIEQI